MGFPVVRAKRLDEKGVGEAVLPCPLGQGALSGRGATLLACGKGAVGGRARIFGSYVWTERKERPVYPSGVWAGRAGDF